MRSNQEVDMDRDERERSRSPLLRHASGVGGLNPQRAFRRYPTRPHARIFFPAENISEFKSELSELMV